MKFFSHWRMKREFLGLLDGDGYNDRTKKAARTRQMELGISDDYIRQLRTAHFQASIEPILRRIAAARRYTRDDEAQIGELSDKLGIGPRHYPRKSECVAICGSTVSKAHSSRGRSRRIFDWRLAKSAFIAARRLGERPGSDGITRVLWEV